METLEIKKEDALRAYENATSTEKTLLENLLGKRTFLNEVTDRIKTVADVLEDNNITQEELDKMFANVPEHLKYQYIAELLCKSLNEGWNADWNDSSEYKCSPCFKMGSSGYHYYGCDHYRVKISDVGSRLCFKSAKLARYAGEQFTDVYKKFMVLK